MKIRQLVLTLALILCASASLEVMPSFGWQLVAGEGSSWTPTETWTFEDNSLSAYTVVHTAGTHDVSITDISPIAGTYSLLCKTSSITSNSAYITKSLTSAPGDFLVKVDIFFSSNYATSGTGGVFKILAVRYGGVGLGFVSLTWNGTNLVFTNNTSVSIPRGQTNEIALRVKTNTASNDGVTIYLNGQEVYSSAYTSSLEYSPSLLDVGLLPSNTLISGAEVRYDNVRWGAYEE